VVLEVLKEQETMSQVAAKYKIDPKNIINWKNAFFENKDLVFDKELAAKKYKDKLKERDKQIDELHRLNGKINAQLEWCKKKSEELGLEY
jgi:transposase-like protein